MLEAVEQWPGNDEDPLDPHPRFQRFMHTAGRLVVAFFRASLT
jgi:hypothetical protein